MVRMAPFLQPLFDTATTSIELVIPGAIAFVLELVVTLDPGMFHTNKTPLLAAVMVSATS